MVPSAAAPDARLARRLGVTALGLAGALALLLLVSARLPGPVAPIVHGQPQRWAGPCAPPDLVIGVVHAAALLVTAYLLVAAALELAVATLPRLPHGVGTRVRLPIGSALVARVAGAGLALSVTVAPAAAVARTAPVVMHVLAAPSSAPPVLHRLDPTVPLDARAADGRSPAPDVAGDVWVIRPGDNLWDVARATLAERSRRPVPDAMVAEYLDRLVARNADALVVPGHPELVYPGQRFVLPAVT